MEKIVEQGLLFDYYGCLLTKRQQEIYEDAVTNDLSLSELAETYGISRQGVHDQIHRCDKILKEYEEKLGCIEKDRKIRKAVLALKEASEKQDAEEIRKFVEEILNQIS
ncbi:MAG: DNA-binding protein [Lachnospiraceae bacterium]|nr:DNA-binding protein [Lachnospiraceae bacterium]